ncbi:MAG: hypothetical protein IIX15_03490 [Clostridia bacterium]|nr:hypothetical protein [Clostridia bacterium]
MVKGRQKQMVVLRTSNSRYYEEAYFVLRDGYPSLSGGAIEGSMMAEANRILDESMLMPQPRKKKRVSRWWTFGVGVAIGIVLGVTVTLLF